MNRILKKGSKIANHFYHGTLVDAIIYKIKAYQKLKRDKKWEALKVKEEVYQETLFDGIKINIYPDDKLSELIFKRNFEINEQLFVQNYLKPGDVFVDIGANIGLYSLIAAKIVGPKGKVFAFEPTQLTYKRLLQNVELNSFNNVQCIQIALSDKTESRTLIVSIDGYGAWNSLSNRTAGEHFNKEIVQCTTWDKFSSENYLTGKTTFIKIDIEGWELYALNGAEQTLRRDDAPDMLVEFTEVNAQSAGTTCAAVYNRLVEFGYKIYSIDAKNRILSHESLRESYPFINLLSTKHVDFVCKRVGFTVLDK